MFYSGEATNPLLQPAVRLLTSVSVSTGVMSVSVPGASAATPAGRRLLAGTADNLVAAEAAISDVLRIPVNITIPSYALYIEILMNGVRADAYVNAPNLLHSEVLRGIAEDLTEPDQENIYMQGVDAAGPNATYLSFIADNYNTPPGAQPSQAPPPAVLLHECSRKKRLAPLARRAAPPTVAEGGCASRLAIYHLLLMLFSETLLRPLTHTHTHTVHPLPGHR